MKPNLPLIIKSCPMGFKPSDSIWGHRRSFHGAELSFVYEEWAPFHNIFNDVVAILGERLNFTPR